MWRLPKISRILLLQILEGYLILFLLKTYHIIGIRKKCLSETLLCFCGEKRKTSTMFDWKNHLIWSFDLGCAMRKHSFGHMLTAKAQISLRIPTVWSGPLVSANNIIRYYRTIEHFSAEQMPIATDKAFFFIWKTLISFLFLHENICCGYSLEAPQRGTSNEYTTYGLVEK